MARPRLKGSTDQSVTIYIVDDTDGTPEQGVVYNTASIALWYRREGSTKVALSLVTLASASAAHTDSGLIHVDDGCYRLDLPDAAVASGAGEVTVGGSIPDMVVLPVTIPLVDYDNQDAVRLGMTSLPNAAADAAGGLAISDAGGLDLDGINTNVSAVLTDTGTTLPATLATIDGIVDDILVDTGTTLPATLATIDNEIAVIDGIVDDILADTNELQGDWVNGGRLDLILDATLADTGELQGDWANGGRLDLILDTAAAGGGLDAAGVRSAVGLASANLDTQLSTIDSEIGVIDGIVDDILVDTGTTIPATITTIDSEIGTVDTVVDAIKAVTDQMAFTASNQLDVQVLSMATDSITASAAAADFIGASEIAASASTEIADLIAADWVAGDASPLAIVAALKADAEWSNLATIDANIDLILEDTGTTLPATLATIDNEIGVIDGIVDTLTTNVPDVISLANINAQVDTALTDIHLDHLFAADYDPSIQPGSATALLNELVESDGGVARFSANALEQGPSGSSSADLSGIRLKSTTIASLDSQTVIELTDGSTDNDAYNNLTLVIEDVSDSDQVSVHRVTDYDGSTKKVTIEDTPVFTIAPTDKIYIMGRRYSDQLTSTETAAAVWGAAVSSYNSASTFGAFANLLDDVESDTSTLVDTRIPETLSLANINTQADTALSDFFTSASQLVDNIWNEDLAGHTTGGSAGKKLSDAETDTAVLVDTRIPDTISLANVNTQVDTALADIHLDHLLAVDYDPASKPGVATALLNEIVESDSGVSRFTTNALEQGPSTSNANLTSILGTSLTESTGGRIAANWKTFFENADAATSSVLDDVGGGAAASSVQIISTTVDTVESTVLYDLVAGSPNDDAYNGQMVMFIDQSDNTQRSIRHIGDYVQADKRISVDSAPDFTIAPGDTVKIFAVTNHVSLVDTCTSNTDMLTSSAVNAEVDTALADIKLDHLLSAAVAGTDVTDNSVFAKLVSSSATADWDDFDNTSSSLKALPSQANITTLVQGVIETNHLDHLLAADYNPAAKPGSSTSLFNELIEDDGGVSRLTANALEQGPSGDGVLAPLVLVDTTVSSIDVGQTNVVLATGSTDDDVYNGRTIVFTDQSTATQKSVRRITDYVGSSKTATLDSAPDFAVVASDACVILSLPGISDSDVAAELGTYDGPSKAEMDSAISAIGAGPLVLADTTITGLVSQTVFNLTAGSTNNDAYIGMMVVVTSASTATQKAVGVIGDYVGATKTVTLRENPGVFTMADNDLIQVIAVATPEAGSGGLTPTETNQLRHWVGIDGTQTAPSTNSPSLATLANQTITNNRLGAWTGTGDNTILGGMKASLSASASLPSDIGGSMDPATDSLQAVRDRGDAEWITGGAGSSNLTDDDVQGMRYILNLDGVQAAPAVSPAPRLVVNTTEIEGLDATEQINTACDTALTDYAGAKPSDITTAQASIEADIAALSIPTSSAVATAVWSESTRALTDKAGFALTSGERDAISALLQTDLQDISVSDVLTQATSALTTYDPPTRLEATSDKDELVADIAGLNNVSASDVLTQATSALTTYDPPTRTELSDDRTIITNAITALNNISTSDVLAQAEAALVSTDAAIAALSIPTSSAISTAVWSESTRALTDKVGFALTSGERDAVSAVVWAESARALTDKAGFALSSAGNTAVSAAVQGALNDPTAGTIASAVWDTTMSGHANAGSFGENTGYIDDIKTDVTNILADTAELQGDWANTGRLDTILDAVSTQASVNTISTNVDSILLDTETTIPAQITALNNITTGDISAQVTSALTSYDAVTQTDLNATQAVITTAITGSSGTVSVAVTSPPQAGDTVTLKRGNPATLVFTVSEAITMSDVLLGISDDAGRSVLKLEGTIDSTTQCTFSISIADALSLREGSFNLDVFEVAGYNSDSGAYTNAKSIVTGPVTIEPLYLRLENS